MKTWLDYYKQKQLVLTIEASTTCNAACPQCNRFYQGSEELINWLVQDVWTLDKFISFFPPHVVQHTRVMHFSGTYGDPGTVPEFVEIVKYIRESSPETSICMSTNGSLRDEQFWWDLGVAGGEKLTVIFAVDGISQETHSRYRRHTQLNQVLKNLETIAQTKATVSVFTVLFEHNINELDQIKEMTRELGAVKWDSVISNRFSHNPITVFKNKKGGAVELKPSPVKILSKSDGRKVVDRQEWKEVKRETHTIECSWNKRGELNISFDGFVWPCCYLEYAGRNEINKAENLPPYVPLKMRDLVDRKEDFNLNNKSLLDIVSDRFYTHTLFESLEIGKSDPRCSMFCYKKK